MSQIEDKRYTVESELICWHYAYAFGRSFRRVSFLTAFLERLAVCVCPVQWNLSGKVNGRQTPRQVKKGV